MMSYSRASFGDIASIGERARTYAQKAQPSEYPEKVKTSEDYIKEYERKLEEMRDDYEQLERQSKATRAMAIFGMFT